MTSNSPAVAWIKQHYDQVLVTVSVLLLAASVAYLLINVHEQRTLLLEASGTGAVQGRPMTPADITPLQQAAAALAKPRQAGVEGRNLLVSDLRVACVNPECGKPIPYEATMCPFCGFSQPKPDDIIRELDNDGDQLPDVWEEKHGLDPRDAADASLDLDGDGFSNLEEYLAGSRPDDATSYPPPQIRVASASASPFKMIFEAVSMINPEKPTFQLNMLTSTRTYFAEIGDVVEGYEVLRYEPAAPPGQPFATLILLEGEREVRLEQGRIRNQDKWAAMLVSLQEMRRFRVVPGDTFRILADDYKVVDIGGGGVVIENQKTKEKFTVPRITREEIQEIQRRRSGSESASALP